MEEKIALYQDASLFNETGDLAYICDFDTYELLFLSVAGLSALGIQKYEGRKCYEVLQGRNAPCPFCNKSSLSSDKVCRWHFYNPKIKRWLLLKDKLINYRGHRARLETAVDVTELQQQSSLKSALESGRFLTESIKLFTNIDDLYGTFNKFLEKLGAFLNAQRAYIFEIDGQCARNSCEWCRPADKHAQDKLKCLDLRIISRWVPYFSQHHCVVCTDIEKLKAVNTEEYALMSLYGVHSFVVAPVEINGRLTAFLGVDDPDPERLQESEPLLLSFAYFISLLMLRVEDRGKLQRRKEELERIIDSIPNGICVFRRDDDGVIRCVAVNPYYAEMMGEPRESFAGATFADFSRHQHPEDRERLKHDTVAVMDQCRCCSGDYRYKVKDGAWRWMHIEGRLVRQPDRSDMAYFAYTDVTGQKMVESSLKESEQRYQLAVSGANLAVWEYDVAAHRMTLPAGSMSQYSVQRCGFTSSVVENVPQSMIRYTLTPDDARRFVGLFDKIEKGCRFVTDDVWFKIKPEERPHCERIYYSVVCNKDGSPVKAYGVGQDITLQKLESERYENSMQKLLKANPRALCTFHLNLTTNSCTDAHGTSDYIIRSLHSDTVDGLFDNIAAIVGEASSLQQFRAVFNSRYLCAQFKNGHTHFSLSYRRCGESGTLHWVMTTIDTARNPDTDDIEAVLYSEDIDDKVKESLISKHLMEEGYEYVALLDPARSTIEFRYFSPGLMAFRALFGTLGKPVDYWQTCMAAVDSWVLPEDKQILLKNAVIQNIKVNLDQNGAYSYRLRSRGLRDGPGCKQIRFFYLDEQKDLIIVEQTDITALYREQQKKVDALQKDAEKANDILDMVSFGISVLRLYTDSERPMVEYINRAACNMLKMVPLDNFAEVITDDQRRRLMAEYVGDFFSSVHPDDREAVRKAFRENIESPFFVMPDYRLHCGDGTYLWVSVAVRLRYKTSEYNVFYACYRDVTEERRLRTELTNRLEREKLLRQEALSANAMKSEFLSNVSHDMRTPLNGVIGYTDLALRAQDPLVIRDYLNKVKKSSEILLQLINDTLDLNKIESGTITLKAQPINSLEFFQKIVTAVRPSIEAKQIHFVSSLSNDAVLGIRVDTLRLQEIFINLLSNAVKFTPSGGTIKFSAECLEKKQDRLKYKFVISDSGIGMSNEFMTKMYEPFTQERTVETANIGGSGLGLSIVKRLVDMMGGTISVSSKLGHGTQFTILMEIERARKEDLLHETVTSSFSQSLCGKRVLLCEDNPLNTEIAKTLLEGNGIKVDCVTNGKTGVEAFAKSPPGFYDAVLMDIRMPVMNGRDAARAIRALHREDARTVPIIAMTADAYDEDVKRCFEAGMDGHIAKPIDPQLLFGELERRCC